MFHAAAIALERELIELGALFKLSKTGQSFRPVKPFHQAAEPNLWVRSGEVEVYQVVQSLKILFCKIRISKAINALLESFWTLTTAADRSALGSSTKIRPTTRPIMLIGSNSADLGAGLPRNVVRARFPPLGGTGPRKKLLLSIAVFKIEGSESGS